jgi:hypothetical protein
LSAGEVLDSGWWGASKVIEKQVTLLGDIYWFIYYHTRNRNWTTHPGPIPAVLVITEVVGGRKHYFSMSRPNTTLYVLRSRKLKKRGRIA